MNERNVEFECINGHLKALSCFVRYRVIQNRHKIKTQDEIIRICDRGTLKPIPATSILIDYVVSFNSKFLPFQILILKSADFHSKLYMDSGAFSSLELLQLIKQD